MAYVFLFLNFDIKWYFRPKICFWRLAVYENLPYIYIYMMSCEEGRDVRIKIFQVHVELDPEQFLYHLGIWAVSVQAV